MVKSREKTRLINSQAVSAIAVPGRPRPVTRPRLIRPPMNPPPHSLLFDGLASLIKKWNQVSKLMNSRRRPITRSAVIFGMRSELRRRNQVPNPIHRMGSRYVPQPKTQPRMLTHPAVMLPLDWVNKLTRVSTPTRISRMARISARRWGERLSSRFFLL